MNAPTVITCDRCGKTTTDPDKWDPEVETGRIFCDACWPVRDTPRAHTTHIDHLPHLGKWQPYCDLCGTIGRGEDYEADAVAIAERHAEIGGFG